MSQPIVVVGAGIVGLATAWELARRGRPVVVLEAEDGIARHQTGHNSGVIHSGLYYPPGSSKARLATAGREALYRFCADEGVPFRRTGKLVVAAAKEDLPRLEELARRGAANGLAGIERLDRGALRERFPRVAGTAALWVPETGLVDFRQVAAAIALRLAAAGGEVRTGARVVAIAREGTGGPGGGGGALRISLASGDELAAGWLVNCAGLYSDRVARLAGERPATRIVPFRGEYYALSRRGAALVPVPIYPVPDPRLPFLDVHLTPRIDGTVEAGPNAVLAFAREGYSWGRVSPRDLADTLGFAGFWRLAGRHWRYGLGEMRRSLSRRAFLASLQRLVPALEDADLLPGGSGVRAQALEPDGTLVDDFRLVHGERAVHVLNAPSPAATAALAIGKEIADRVEERMR